MRWLDPGLTGGFEKLCFSYEGRSWEEKTHRELDEQRMMLADGDILCIRYHGELLWGWLGLGY